MSTAYWLVTVFLSAGMGQMLGARRGALQERDRVLDGLNITQAVLSSRSLRVLRGWIEGHYTRDELSARVQEYGAEQNTKHDGEQQALLERLGRHGEKKA